MITMINMIRFLQQQCVRVNAEDSAGNIFFNTLQQTFLQASFRGRKLKAFCPKIKTLNITRNPLFGHSFLSLALGAIISNKIFIVFCLFLCRFVFEWLQLFSNVISVVSNSIAPSFNLLHCCDCVPSLHKSFHFRAFVPSSWIPISQPNFWVKFAFNAMNLFWQLEQSTL